MYIALNSRNLNLYHIIQYLKKIKIQLTIIKSID